MTIEKTGVQAMESYCRSSNEKEQLQRYESTGLLVQSPTLTLLLTAATGNIFFFDQVLQ